MYLVSAPLYYSSLALINNRAILWRWDKGVKLNVGFAVQRDICYNHAHCEKLAQFVQIYEHYTSQSSAFLRRPQNLKKESPNFRHYCKITFI